MPALHGLARRRKRSCQAFSAVGAYVRRTDPPGELLFIVLVCRRADATRSSDNPVMTSATALDAERINTGQASWTCEVAHAGYSPVRFFAVLLPFSVYRAIHDKVPPSTRISSPVICSPSAEASIAITPATTSGPLGPAMELMRCKRSGSITPGI